MALLARPVFAQSQPAQILTIAYLLRENDPAYQRSTGPDGVARDPSPSPYPGAELGIRDVGPAARATGLEFRLDRRAVAAEGDVAAAMAQLAADGAVAIIADLPASDLAVAALALPKDHPPIFNIRHADLDLRARLCGAGVFHVAPSTADLTDALAQFVVRKNWRRLLVLYGPLDADRALADRFQESAKKFGARVIEARAFVYGHDPRNREHNSIGLLSADVDYDVMFIADTDRDFGRFVGYEQLRARPVIGTAGLEASAWSPVAESFGAPQVNNRFARLARRPMTDVDWCAWLAVHAVAEAAVRLGARTPATLAGALTSPDLRLDVSKGMAVSFRAWDHQLRQPIMLRTTEAVIAYAPLEGFLHETSNLDTLGLGPAEAACAHP